MSFLSSFALLTGIISVASAAAPVFSDVPSDAWFSAYVQQAAESGIVSGYKDANGNLTGRYGPGNEITVAETLKIASEGAGYDETAFPSTDYGDDWVAPYKAVAMNCCGIAKGFALEWNDWDFDRPAARVEVAAVLAKAFHVSTKETEQHAFSDVSTDMYYEKADVHFSYAAEIDALAQSGVLSGDTDASGHPTGTFRPTDPINRAEVAKMIMRMRAEYGTPGAAQ